jgi:glycolate oxidase iron-sulfur subunit
MYTEPAGGLEDTERGRTAQALIRSCVHCGFCLDACPTYRVVGDERDGPRGRIYLIKQLVEGGPAGETTRTHLDRCLTCRACETACPSGVQYGRLLDIGRAIVEERTERPVGGRMLRSLLTTILPNRWLFAAALRAGQWFRPLMPRRLAALVPPGAARGYWPPARHARRMAVLEGCVQPALAPDINAAAARVLDRIGISLVRVPGETCCGALSHHLGRSDRARMQARKNVDACIALLETGVEAIVSTASGCGVAVKEYGELLRNDGGYADKARRVASATRDLCEVLSAADLGAHRAARDLRGRVAWQAPCTLQHGQRLGAEVEVLLRIVGYELTTVGDPQQCCGSAGAYSLLQRDLAVELRGRKLTALQRDEPDVIATANVGCLVHLRAAGSTPVLHWIELVDRALS